LPEAVVRSTERSNRGLKAEINLTPMIDILLVLLILFMAISPSLSVGVDSQIPQPSSEVNQSEAEEAIVVSITGHSSLRINQEPVPVDALQARLRAILKSRRDRTVFLQADPSLPFEAVAAVIEDARQAGAERVGLLTHELSSGEPGNGR
jgi:biopolymer transport protein ExbD